MRRAVLLALNLLPLLGGCHALVRDGVAVEYVPGTMPTTTVAKHDATFKLYAPEHTTFDTWGQNEVKKGTTVGFRRQPDGSMVAVLGDKVEPIPDCRSVWYYTPNPVTRWERFLVGTRDKCENAAMSVFLGPVIIIGGCITGEWP